MAFSFIAIVFLVLAGALAAAGLIAKKRPNAKELIDKIVPYQGWIGLVLLVLSLINFILLLVRIGDMTGTKAMGRTFGGASGMQWVTWVLYLVSSIVGIGLGFLLGYGMINKLLAAAKETSETPAVEPATESEATPDDEAIAQAAAAPEAAPPAAGEPVGEALYLKLQGIQQPLGL